MAGLMEAIDLPKEWRERMLACEIESYALRSESAIAILSMSTSDVGESAASLE